MKQEIDSVQRHKGVVECNGTSANHSIEPVASASAEEISKFP
jgi:hypothetical protein